MGSGPPSPCRPAKSLYSASASCRRCAPARHDRFPASPGTSRWAASPGSLPASVSFLPLTSARGQAALEVRLLEQALVLLRHRSEERRVGKECRYGRSTGYYKKEKLKE